MDTPYKSMFRHISQATPQTNCFDILFDFTRTPSQVTPQRNIRTMFSNAKEIPTRFIEDRVNFRKIYMTPYALAKE